MGQIGNGYKMWWSEVNLDTSPHSGTGVIVSPEQINNIEVKSINERIMRMH